MSDIAHPYLEFDGQVIHNRQSREGIAKVPLCNFTARITAEEARDDGLEIMRTLKIRGHQRNKSDLPEITVPSSTFQGMAWVSAWGSRAVVFAGQSNRDHLRTAIQLLSGDPPTRTVYTHLGWRLLGGKWVYLHAGGAIGPDGLFDDVHFSPTEGNLGSYRLLSAPPIEELRNSLNASLRLLDVTPKRIGYPLLASVFRSVLSEMLPIDFSIFIEGPSGTCKSELTAMVQAHFGAAFNRLSLPATWTSTENYLERQAFLSKDAILVIDDFSPQISLGAIGAMHQKAERVLRSQGNRAGRGRMKADGSLRAAFYPRGLILASGEDVPRGQSLRARLLILGVQKGDVDLDVLTQLQEDARAGHFTQVTSAFIQYASRNYDRIKEWTQSRLTELRTEMQKANSLHRRTPDALASLAIGLEAFLDFCKAENLLKDEELHDFRTSGFKSLLEAGSRQEGYQAGEDAIDRFVEYLRSSLTSGLAHVADAHTGSAPQSNTRAWGWRERGLVQTHPDSAAVPEWESKGVKIGWIDGKELLLNADSTFGVIQQRAREQNEVLPLTKNILIKRLVERKIVLPSATEKKNVTKRTVEGRRELVLVIPAHYLLSESGESGDTVDADAVARAKEVFDLAPVSPLSPDLEER